MEAPSEAQLSRSTGGWISFPFIIATTVSVTLAFGGWTSNLIVYLIKEFNVESIDAAQISNLVNGAGCLVPVLAAIIADSYLGCYSIIWISSLISLLGTILLALTATIDSLRPKPCEVGSTSCSPTPRVQYVVLYAAIFIATLGNGGLRSIISTMGANQFNKPKDQGIFFNWFFFFVYGSNVVATTVIVYVEDNVSWKVGFFICVATNVLGLVMFLVGSRFYTNSKPEGSPFTSLARVVFASIRKRKIPLPSTSEDFYHGHTIAPEAISFAPSKTFRFFNRAAIKSEGDIKPNGSTTNKAWRLCSVQEVEDFKALIKILPLWSSSFFLGTTIGVQGSMSVLQALAMDRHLGPNFQIPAGSILVFVMVSTALFLALFDKFIFPTWKKLTGKSLTPLQRIGVGHVLNFLCMGVSALVESKRLKVAKSNQSSNIVPMSVLWLVPQLALVGIAEAFHFPGQVAFYYQEFPTTLKNMATAMLQVILGVAFYLTTALIDVVRRTTTWLPVNINNGRLDNVYWVLVVGGILNFGYYVTCAWFYKYQNMKELDHYGSTSDE
ncbi:protein NRT1/ PTR FAMILY 2.7-like [Lycium barbarum]|uniref:protein NRT1/ PTR FAMILY 2.7-like n=1 Tax=Lycium barbarum TaxID=112863 RepID=UPI00293EA85F|nr:protein NRT1/ PTR FAMILY 2.7-like [Lycium barbarum]